MQASGNPTSERTPMRFETRDLVEEAGKKGARSYSLDELSICRILGKIWFVGVKKDLTISANIIRDGFWEAWVTCWVTKNVAPRSTVLDIGANLGYYTLILAEMGCRVTAIEPQEEVCHRLSAAVTLNNYKNVSVINTAIGRERGTVSLHIDPVNNGGSSIKNATQGSTEVRVPITTLDTFTDKFDFIKIDAEGAEADIWYGGQKYFERNKSVVLLMEWASLRYPDGIAFARDIFEKANVSYVDGAGNEVVVATPEELMVHVKELMLVIRFK